MLNGYHLYPSNYVVLVERLISESKTLEYDTLDGLYGIPGVPSSDCLGSVLKNEISWEDL